MGIVGDEVDAGAQLRDVRLERVVEIKQRELAQGHEELLKMAELFSISAIACDVPRSTRSSIPPSQCGKARDIQSRPWPTTMRLYYLRGLQPLVRNLSEKPWV